MNNHWVSDKLKKGGVIPAHPLALSPDRRFDERYQRALTCYYHAAGVAGIAVGVHTTQFSIRDPAHGLFEPVLALASETIRACDENTGRQTIRIAGVTGDTKQAVTEATLARDLGYHLGLLSLAHFREATVRELVEHTREVASILPVFGFYLQPAVGGIPLPNEFWAAFAKVPGVLAIKVAPFNQYKTLDVIRGVAASGRSEEIALYTGNDDHIILDLCSRYEVSEPPNTNRILEFSGGLLGHWACWTKRAVQHAEQCQKWKEAGELPVSALTLAAQVTDANASLFDAANEFRGCIAGIHYVLQKQGLMRSIHCLDPEESLSPGQQEEIDRVYAAYPFLNDDEFVSAHLDEWLR